MHTHAYTLFFLGGIEETLKKLIGLEMSLGQPPCCCLRFLPMVKINERFIMYGTKKIMNFGKTDHLYLCCKLFRVAEIVAQMAALEISSY